MKFIPILFSTPMVQAILEDRKTQTRRVVKPQPDPKYKPVEIPTSMLNFKPHWGKWNWVEPTGLTHLKFCPYGQPGDVLWVRENFYAMGMWQPDGVSEKNRQKWRFDDLTEYYHNKYPYRYFDNPPTEDFRKGRTPSFSAKYYTRASIHMPKAACRIFLQVKSIRVERLKEISEDDAIAEGVKWDGNLAYPAFHALWSNINGPESWDANPWAWVVEFERIEKPENFL